jgi:hypothetical protein
LPVYSTLLIYEETSIEWSRFMKSAIIATLACCILFNVSSPSLMAVKEIQVQRGQSSYLFESQLSSSLYAGSSTDQIIADSNQGFLERWFGKSELKNSNEKEPVVKNSINDSRGQIESSILPTDNKASVDQKKASNHKADKLAKQKAYQEQLAQKQAQANADKLAKQKVYQEQLAAQKAKVEADKLAKEKIYQEQLAQKQAQANADKLAKQKVYQEQLAAQKAKAEADKLAKEKIYQEQLAQKQAQANADKLAKQKVYQEQLAVQKAKAEADKLAKEKIYQEQREQLAQKQVQANADKITKQKIYQEQLAAQKAKTEADKLAQQKIYQEQQEQLAQKQAQANADKLVKQKVYQEQLAAQKAKVESDKLAQQKIYQEQQEQLAQKQAQANADKLAKQKVYQEQLATQKAKVEADKLAKERAYQEQQEQLAQKQAQANADKLAKQKIYQEQLATQKATAEADKRAKQIALQTSSQNQKEATISVLAAVKPKPSAVRFELEKEVLKARALLQEQAKKNQKEHPEWFAQPKTQWQVIQKINKLESLEQLQLGSLSWPKSCTDLTIIQRALEKHNDYAVLFQTWQLAYQKANLEREDLNAFALGAAYPFSMELLKQCQELYFKKQKLNLLMKAQADTNELSEQILKQQLYGLATDLDKLALDQALNDWNFEIEKIQAEISKIVNELKKVLNTEVFELENFIIHPLAKLQLTREEQLRDEYQAKALQVQSEALDHAKTYGAYMQIEKTQLLQIHQIFVKAKISELEKEYEYSLKSLV